MARKDLAGRIRIGVLGLFHPKILVVRPAFGHPLELIGHSETVLLESGETARISLALEGISCRTPRRAFVAAAIELISRVPGRSVEGAAGSGEFILSVPGESGLPNRIERRYIGALRVSRGFSELGAQGVYEPKESGVHGAPELLAVVTIDLEVAVASVVAAESPTGTPMEALKAQAVVTRSFYTARGRHGAFDFCDTTHCQFLRHCPRPHSPAWEATRQTRGLILSYQGVPFAALYSGSCGGRTRTPAEISLAGGRYPYYPVTCDYCRRFARCWWRRLDLRQFAAAADLAAHAGSEPARLRLNRSAGREVIPGDNYELRANAGAIELRGRGAGHGVGLCQLGAAGMAAEGAAFDVILRHYFPNAEIGSVDGRDLGDRTPD